MSNVLNDLKYACRVVVRDKTFALATVLTLGLCIGAHTAIFTVVNAVLLRPLPVDEPERLVWVVNAYPKAGATEAENGVPDYYDRRQAVTAFEATAMYNQTGRTIGTRAGVERVPGLNVTTSLFGLLRARPLRGRVFDEQDGVVGQNQKVVLSYALWQQLFAGADDAIGRDLRINGVPHTVIGIMPPDFQFVDAAVKFWLPLAFSAQERSDDSRHSNSYSMVARLKPGATMEQAQRQIDALNAANLERFPAMKQILIDAGFTTRVEALQDRLVREVRRTLYLLWGGVLVVLLIGCVNITNLSLVRATARAREFATRQALGAGRWQLTRQLLVESLLLTTVAGAVGLLIGYWSVQALTLAVADRIPRASEIAIDAMAILVTLAVTFVVGALMALIPVVHVNHVSVAQAIRDEGRGGTASRGARMVRRTLVTTQVAFAFVLLVGAGLLFASFREVLQVRTGFDPNGVLTGLINLPGATYSPDQNVAFFYRLQERLKALPGVTAAGLGSSTPFTENYNDSVILAEGYVAQPGESLISPARNAVTPGYFEALRIPLKRGRFIDERDKPPAAPVIVVGERLAGKFWPGQDPIGKRMFQPNNPKDILRPGPNTRWLTVIGVVGEVKQRGLAGVEERFGAYYFPVAQSTRSTMSVVIRAAGDPLALAPAVRREIAAIDPELPFFDVSTMESRMTRSVAGRRTAMVLALAFGAIALLLATVGIYGVLAYHVTQRTREIGIRMALGSDAGQVFGLVLREGALLLVVGFALGLAGAFAMRGALQGELFGVDALEPSVLATVCGLLATSALVACAVPARRAARIDPVVALAE